MIPVLYSLLVICCLILSTDSVLGSSLSHVQSSEDDSHVQASPERRLLKEYEGSPKGKYQDVRQVVVSGVAELGNVKLYDFSSVRRDGCYLACAAWPRFLGPNDLFHPIQPFRKFYEL